MMELGFYVDDINTLTVETDGQIYKDAVFEGGEKANFHHPNINLFRNVRATKEGDYVKPITTEKGNTAKLEPATQYILKNATTVGFY